MMKYQTPLLRGRLVQRYKRFLADVTLDTGETVTASCPNTGAMIGLSSPGMTVYVSTNDLPTRKYRHTLELVEANDAERLTLVGINTGLPNRIVTEAIRSGQIASLAGYETLRGEVKYGSSSRIDMLLEHPHQKSCYVEVKNVHLSRVRGAAEFPDSVTARGAKHLVELAAMVAAGHRAVMVYLVQRGDVDRFTLAEDVDPVYAAAFRRARGEGVEALAYVCSMSLAGIEVAAQIPIMVAGCNDVGHETELTV
jgi:sugar fermentation stimulation protein A